MVDAFSLPDVPVAVLDTSEIVQSPEVPRLPASGAPVVRASLWLRGWECQSAAPAGASDDHDSTGEPESDGGADGDVHGSGGRDSAPQLSVAEERGERRRCNLSELHDSGNNDIRQWIDFRRGGEQHGGDGDECDRDADGECGFGGGFDCLCLSFGHELCCVHRKHRLRLHSY